MKLLRDNVLINPEHVPQLSEIIDLTDITEIKPPPRGTVIAVGPGVCEVTIGDTVHFETFDWPRAPEGNIILKEGEILAKERD